MTLKDTYHILQMKKHYASLEEAKQDLSTADPDIIPPGSQVYSVREDIGINENTGVLTADITITPCTGTIVK